MDVHQTFNCWFNADERKTNDNVTPSVLPIQLTNTTGTQLEHLNEDCLLEIFSSDSLTLMDLCSLAETCTRLKEITRRVFPKCYRIAREYPERKRYKFQLENGTILLKCLHDVGRILRSFESNLFELSIEGADQDLVSLIGKYCSGVTLTHLRISEMNSISIEGVKMHMNSILRRLRKLTVFNCDFLKDVTFQNLNFASLIQLEITNSSGCVAILKQSFPNLERFIWYFSHVYTKKNLDSASHILYTFIRHHGQLKTIEVREGRVPRSELLRVIDSACKGLEELTIMKVERRDTNFKFSTQGGISNLKTLELSFMRDMFNTHHIALLQAAKSLEKIKIFCDEREPIQIAEVLSQLPNLRELHWSGFYLNRIPWTMLAQLRKVNLVASHGEFDAVGLLNIISKLINLEELVFESRQMINLTKGDFSRIIKIVERREHVLTLKCCFDFKPDDYCNLNQKVKLIKIN